MTTKSKYFSFLKEKGVSLTEMNPGSDEYALSINEVDTALRLLQEDKVPILGGDIISKKSGKLVYAYQLWGSQYHSLNWYVDKLENESETSYLKRSHEIATQAVKRAGEVANDLKEECYICMVLE